MIMLNEVSAHSYEQSAMS